MTGAGKVVRSDREMKPGKFVEALLVELESNFYNSHDGNYDAEILGPLPSAGQRKIYRSLRKFLLKRRLAPASDLATLFGALKSFAPFLHRFDALYDALADSGSKDVFVKLIAFGVLGHEKVKLPLNNPQFWKQRSDLVRLANSVDNLVSGRFRLQLFDLGPIGYPIKLYAPSVGPQTVFLLKQYDYSSDLTRIKAEKDDVVIDAGGCWGDTALYFAHEVGDRGQILTVECIPGNLEILEKNLKLNAVLQHRVTIVRNPLWGSPGMQLSFVDNGPSSVGTLAAKKRVDGVREYTTTTIDEVVSYNHLPTVNYLKMDVEGAELEALKGAETTLKKFQPKLAISVYHSVNDLVDVFEFISSLGLGYRFFMGHYTIHWHETILFAICEASARNARMPD